MLELGKRVGTERARMSNTGVCNVRVAIPLGAQRGSTGKKVERSDTERIQVEGYRSDRKRGR
jgi:hypothetical protein